MRTRSILPPTGFSANTQAGDYPELSVLELGCWPGRTTRPYTVFASEINCTEMMLTALDSCLRTIPPRVILRRHSGLVLTGCAVSATNVPDSLPDNSKKALET